jgi:hypothetical protein
MRHLMEGHAFCDEMKREEAKNEQRPYLDKTTHPKARDMEYPGYGITESVHQFHRADRAPSATHEQDEDDHSRPPDTPNEQGGEIGVLQEPEDPLFVTLSDAEAVQGDEDKRREDKCLEKDGEGGGQKNETYGFPCQEVQGDPWFSG